MKIIDSFFQHRCEVAHKGAKAKYPKIGDIVTYRNAICDIVMEIDQYLADYGKKIFNKQAWQRISDGSKILFIG